MEGRGAAGAVELPQQHGPRRVHSPDPQASNSTPNPALQMTGPLMVPRCTSLFGGPASERVVRADQSTHRRVIGCSGKQDGKSPDVRARRARSYCVLGALADVQFNGAVRFLVLLERAAHRVE
jgi:hypothetical protein